jgi:AAA domain
MQQLDGCLGVVAVSNMRSKGGGLRVAFHRRNLARLQRVVESSAVKKAAADAATAAGPAAAGATAGSSVTGAAAAIPSAPSSSGRGSGRGSSRGSGRGSGSSVRGGRAVTGTGSGRGSASKTFGTGRGQQQGPAYGATSVKLKAPTAAAIAAGSSSDTDVFVHNLGSTQSVLREWEALNALDKLPLMQDILMTPEQKVSVTSANGSSSNCSSSNGSSSSTKAAAAQIRATRAAPSAATLALSKLLQPLDEHSKGVGAGQLGQAFVTWMQGRFNPSQRLAIAAAASDEGFTLVKGPPGTGKTTTLTALLNALHVREYNRFYTAMLGLARAEDGVDTEAAWTKLRRTKPHILVTAPSNAGVDNVLQRILANGFLDGGGGRYNPPVIRVGRGAGSASKAVVLDDQVLCATTVLLHYCMLLYACLNASYCSPLVHRVQFVH